MSLSTLQETSKTAALAVVEQGPTTLQNLKAAFVQNFPPEPLSATRQKFLSGADVTRNEALATLLAVTEDACDAVLNDINVMEQYVHLTIPKMEDGNNFGVTVQLAALKQMTDDKEKLEKGLEELSKYASARAEALEKCKLPSESTTTSTTTSESNASGNNTEKGDITSSEKKTSTEEKKTSTTTGDSPDLVYRKLAVTAVDVCYYRKAKSLFQATLTSCMICVDFLSKNQDKIAAPKGSGSGSAFSSMY